MAWAALVFAVGAVGLLAFSPLGSAVRVRLGLFERGHFKEVVAQARALSPTAGGEFELRLDDPHDPSSLRTLAPGESFDRGQGAGHVWARVSPAGDLTVVIQTKDRGHAGESGYAYSDVPLVATVPSGAWSFLNVPGRLNQVQPKMQIDGQWWEVVNRLD